MPIFQSTSLIFHSSTKAFKNVGRILPGLSFYLCLRTRRDVIILHVFKTVCIWYRKIKFNVSSFSCGTMIKKKISEQKNFNKKQTNSLIIPYFYKKILLGGPNGRFFKYQLPEQNRFKKANCQGATCFFNPSLRKTNTLLKNGTLKANNTYFD